MGQSSPSSVFVRFGVMVLTLHVVGEITDHDVAVMEKGYRWMIYTPPVRLCSLYSTNHHMFLLTRPLFLRRCCLTYFGNETNGKKLKQATAISFSFLIWQLMKKQYPRPRMITRLFWGGLSAGAGGLLGFGAAGVAAAMEVEDKVEDVER